MGKIKFTHTYEYIISVENLLAAWHEFLKGKRSKYDVQMFRYCLFDNILSLRDDLENGNYKHGGYHAFNISDPKPRNIHKATVRDRLVHHAIYRVLYPFFDRTFISDSHSCRVEKGTHRAMRRFEFFARKVSRNNTRTVWILKCDIKKFFASVDHDILKEILRQNIPNTKILALLDEVIGSFQSTGQGKGLPLGNLTSQLLVNIYMNEFDQYVKHRMKEKFYVRYADDFVFLSGNRGDLLRLIPTIQDFLQERLKLELHPQKLFLKTLASGVDFLGWVHFPDHRILRTATRRRMMKRISRGASQEATTSYLGMLKHGYTKQICREILSIQAENFADIEIETWEVSVPRY